MRPAISWPGMGGSWVPAFTSSRRWRSVWHTPAARTCTRTSSGPGCGFGTWTNFTVPSRSNRTARMALLYGGTTENGLVSTEIYIRVAGIRAAKEGPHGCWQDPRLRVALRGARLWKRLTLNWRERRAGRGRSTDYF